MSKKAKSSTRRIKILGVAVLGVLVVAGGLYGYRKHRMHVQVARWRSQGLAADARGDYAAAVDNLTSYLTRQPEDREATVAYIDARPHIDPDQPETIKDTVRALRYLLQVDPSLTKYSRQLMDIYRTLALRTEAVDAADLLLKYDPANGDAFDVKTTVLAELKRFPEALATTRLWAQLDPLNLNAQIRKYQLMAITGNSSEQIVAEADAWRKAHGAEQARFELLKSEAYAVANDREDCRTWLRQAEKETPPDDQFSAIIVRQLVVYGDQGESLSVLKDLVGRGAGEELREALLARLWELAQYRDVTELSEKMDLKNVNTPVNMVALTCLAEKSQGHEEKSGKLKALLIGRGAAGAAWSAIIESGIRDSTAARHVVAACQNALRLDPANGYIRYFLGEALAELEETDLAVEAFQNAAAANQTWGFPLSRMSELLLQEGKLSPAMQAAIVGLRRTPNTTTAITAARAAAALDEAGQSIQPADFLALLDQIRSVTPDAPEVNLLRAQFLARTGKKEEAAGALHAILATRPPPSESTILRMNAISRIGKLGMEREIMGTDEKAYGLTPTLALSRALEESSAGNTAAGLQLIVNARQKSPKGQSLAWELAMARYMDMTASAGAADAWLAMSAKYPQQIDVQRGALECAALKEDRPALEQIMNRLKAIVGEQSLVCSLARARILSQSQTVGSDDRELIELLKQIVSAHPALAEPRILWADHLEQQGKTDDAIDQLQMAAIGDPDSSSLSLRLARLYIKKGDYERATPLLDRVAASRFRTPEEVKLTVRMLASEGEYAKATALLEQEPSAHADDELALAELYWRRNQLDKAEAIVAGALEKPDQRNIAFAARFYAAEGKAEQARAAIDKLDALNLSPGQKEPIVANYFAAEGKSEEAIAQFRAAIKAAPDQPGAYRSLISYLFSIGRSDDAVREIDNAIQAFGTDQAFHAIKAALPVLLETARFDELRPVVLNYLLDPVNNAAPLGALTMIAEATRSHDPVKISSQAEVVLHRYSHLEGAQRWAIGVYLKVGKSNEAALAVARTMIAFPDSAEVASQATFTYSTLQRWDEMLDAARQWRSRSRDHATPDVSIARALLGLNRPAEAIAQLEPYLPSAQAHPDAHSEMLMAYVEALVAGGHVDQAADLLLPLATRTFAWRAACLRFATSKLNPQDFRAWIERITPLIDRSSSDEVMLLAEAWAELAGRSGDGKAELEKASALFAAVEADPKASAAALTEAALFAERSSQPRKAITLYRRVLSLDPAHAIALNNLAVLLVNNGGSLKEAQTLVKSAVDAHPGVAEFLDTAAMVDVKSGDVKSAIAALKRAIQLDPAEIRIRITLAQVLADSRQNDEARGVISGLDAMGVDPAKLAQPLQKQLADLKSRLSPSVNAKPASALAG